MTWSNVDAKRQYVVVLSESASGRLSGPWGRHKVIFGKDGGHGMLFRKLDGSLAFALHQPNAVRRERPKFFPVEDDGETLRIVQETSKSGRSPANGCFRADSEIVAASLFYMSTKSFPFIVNFWRLMPVYLTILTQ